MTRRFWNWKDRKTDQDEYSGDLGGKQQNTHPQDVKKLCHAAHFTGATRDEPFGLSTAPIARASD
jgi:hypothetical protein